MPLPTTVPVKTFEEWWVESGKDIGVSRTHAKWVWDAALDVAIKALKDSYRPAAAVVVKHLKTEGK